MKAWPTDPTPGGSSVPQANTSISGQPSAPADGTPIGDANASVAEHSDPAIRWMRTLRIFIRSAIGGRADGGVGWLAQPHPDRYRFAAPSCFSAPSAFSTSRNTWERSAPLADAPLSAALGANMPVTIW